MAKLSQSNIDLDVASLPTGMVFPVVGADTPPSGTLECDGSLISQTTYAALFSGQPLSIGTYYGTPPAGQFYLPDFRGRFLRGVAHGVSRDPDRATRSADEAGGPTGDVVGSVQGDEFESHRHSITTYRGWTDGFDMGTARTDLGSSTRQSNFTGGNETRPKNINVIWVIKY